MYQVITLYGDFEPWWFLEDWQDDIVTQENFEDFQEALQFFEGLWEEHRKTYPYFQSRRDLLAVFWNDTGKRWCEECSEPIQSYHSIMLLKDGQVLPFEKYMDYYEQANAHTQNLSTCSIFTNNQKD